MSKNIFLYSKYIAVACLIVVTAVLAYFVYIVLDTKSGTVPMSDRNEDGLEHLDSIFKQQEYYITKHKNYVDSMDQKITGDSLTMPLEMQYYQRKKLYYESHLFTFDYSLRFSQIMCSIAWKMKDPARLAEAQTCYAYSLCRSGFFKEGIDYLDSIRIDEDNMPDSVLATYYTYGGRCWHDLADYTDYGNLSVQYKLKGNEWLQKALPHITNKSDYYYVTGKMLLWREKLKEARPYYMKALSLCNQQDWERKSILLSTIASIDSRLKAKESATHYYIMAVDNDVRHAIVETNAIRSLAVMLFYDYKDAYRSSEYLTYALNNAQYFGTRYRINQMGVLMSVFEGQRRMLENKQKQTMGWAFGIISLLALLLVHTLIRNLHHSKVLHDSQQKLKETNLRLDEANRIKNQYLGHYIDEVSETIVDISDFALLAEQKLKMKQDKAVLQLIQNLKDHYNKKTIREDFDQAFMLLFPTFIDEFNALMTDEGKQEKTEKGGLTPILRIFALIRLGITDNNQIAKVLDYSLNTVYNYRIRTRNKAIDPDNFENKIALIGL